VADPRLLAELSEAASVYAAVQSSTVLHEQLSIAAQACVTSLKQGGRLIFAGNGGSAADAQHLAAELVVRFCHDRPSLSAMALNTDTSMLTAIGNDYGFEALFARQLEAQASKGDVFIALSTSGHSKNIIQALHTSRRMGLLSIGFTGASGGAMLDLCDLCLCAPTDSTPRIQEVHGLLGHVLCSAIERAMFPLLEL